MNSPGWTDRAFVSDCAGCATDAGRTVDHGGTEDEVRRRAPLTLFRQLLLPGEVELSAAPSRAGAPVQVVLSGRGLDFEANRLWWQRHGLGGVRIPPSPSSGDLQPVPVAGGGGGGALGGVLGQVGGHVQTRDGELDQSAELGAGVANLQWCVCVGGRTLCRC